MSRRAGGLVGAGLASSAVRTRRPYLRLALEGVRERDLVSTLRAAGRGASGLRGELQEVPGMTNKGETLTKPAQIVLAEDHKILRDGLRAIFASESDIELAGEATDGREAMSAARELQPDLLILDLSMPRMDGLTALKEIKRLAPRTRVLVMTVHRTEEYVFKAIEDGADGYVLKDASAIELLLAVRSVLAGERYLSAAVATHVIAALLKRKGAREEAPGPRSGLDLLSTREREVLKLVTEGYRSREIGEFLYISEKTVEKHRANLMRKLGVNSVAALIALAIEKGLITR